MAGAGVMAWKDDVFEQQDKMAKMWQGCGNVSFALPAHTGWQQPTVTC